jgi:hypothetical protein
MFLIRFGKWSTCSTKWFIWHRIYWKGKWTPFIKIKKRYKKQEENKKW